MITENSALSHYSKYRVSLFYKLFLVAFEIGFGFQLNIVGMISISELFLFFNFIYYLIFIRKPLNKDMSTLTNIYIALLIVQVISEFANGNSFGNAAKGLAITVFSYCHLFFLYFIFKRDRSLLIWLLLGIVLRLIIFPDDIIAGGMGNAMSGENAAYLKFVIAPFLSNILLIYVTWRNSRNASLLFIVLGLIFIIGGARSGGLSCILTGIFAIILMRKHFISPQKMLGYVGIGLVLTYGGYVIYVNQVLSGKITSGNSEQLLRVSNPYNPMGLLMVGRSEVFVGAEAFADKPLFGWGSWKKDSETGYMYHNLQLTIGNSDQERNNIIGTDVIPTHSVLIGYGTFNGIFAFVLMLYMFCFIVKRGYLDMGTDRKYIYILIYFLLQYIWNSIFSPLSHFRQTLPLYMAFIIASYVIEYQYVHIQERRIRKHS